MQATPSQQGRILAALLSAILPGAGHLLMGRRRKGLFLLFVFAAWSLAYCGLRLPQTIYGAIWPILVLMALCVFSTWDVTYAGTRRVTSPSQWWLAILLPAAFLSGVVHETWAFRAAGFRFFQVATGSMAPTIHLGDHVLVDGRYYSGKSPQRGDLITFTSPMDPRLYLIKRVIAVGGETIIVKGRNVFINNQLISEPYARLEDPLLGETQTGPVTLPPGKLFVMGDYRSASFDSRYKKFGLVDVSTVVGKATYSLATLTSEPKKLD